MAEDMSVDRVNFLNKSRTIWTADVTSTRVDGLDVLQDMKPWWQDLEVNGATRLASFSVGQNEAFQLVVIGGSKA